MVQELSRLISSDFQTYFSGIQREKEQELSRPIAIVVEKNSLGIPQGNWSRVLQPIFYGFWKEVLKGFHRETEQEFSRQISHWGSKECLKNSIGKLSKSSQDQFPLIFTLLFKDSIGKLNKSTQDQLPLMLKEIP